MGKHIVYIIMKSRAFSGRGKRKAKKMEKSVDKREKRRYTDQAVLRGTVRIGKTGQELRKKVLDKGIRI